FVVAGGLRATALRERRATRPVRARRAGEVWPVRLPPGPRLHLVLRGRDVDRVMQPAVPGRRHHRSLGGPAVDHPTPLEAERRVDLAAFGAEVVIAELVLADEFAVEARPDLRAEGLAVPPREKADEERLHARGHAI